MGWNRTTFETLVLVATTAVVSLSLLLKFSNSGQGWEPAASLMLLCTLACMVESHGSGALRSWERASRAAGSPGTGLGSLTLPWVFGSLMVALGRTGHLLVSYHHAVAASALQLILLCWPAVGSVAGASPSSGRAPNGGNGSNIVAGKGLSFIATGLVAAATSRAGGTPADAALALGMAMLCCATLFLVMVRLPRTFTIGENTVVSQAAVFLGSYAVRALLLCDSRPLPSGTIAASDEGCELGSPFQTFVACLIFGSTTLAATLAALIVWPGRTRAEGSPQAGQNGGRAAAAASDSKGPGASRGTSAVHRRGEHAALRQQAEEMPGGCLGAVQGQQRLASWRAAAALVVLAGGVCALLKPAAWSIAYATSTTRRAGVLAYWAALMAASLPAMQQLTASNRVSNIIVRKGYHLLAVALFLPAAALEPQLLGVSLAIAYALLAAVELARILDVPFVGPKVHSFMTSFTDSRDSGAILVTHFTLLLGMATPLWLSDALVQLPGEGISGQRGYGNSEGASAVAGSSLAGSSGWGSGGGMDAGGIPVWPEGIAGIVIIGFGDTAASVVGRLLGRHPICFGSKKTWEGTLGGFLATMAGWWLVAAACNGGSSSQSMQLTLAGWPWPGLAGAAVLSCLLEACTEQLDNLFVPLHHFVMVCCTLALGRER